MIQAPKSSVDALLPVWHHQHNFGSLQRSCKRRRLGRLQERGNIQVLRVGQHAAPSSLHTPWPTVPHFGQKFKDTFLPSMADEQVALQTIWILHQSPTHLPGILCHWLDVLLIHGVDAWPIVLRQIVLRPRLNLAAAKGRLDLLPQK